MKCCPQCGQEYPDQYRFCRKDGTALDELKVTANVDAPGPAGSTSPVSGAPQHQDTASAAQHGSPGDGVALQQAAEVHATSTPSIASGTGASQPSPSQAKVRPRFKLVVLIAALAGVGAVMAVLGFLYVQAHRAYEGPAYVVTELYTGAVKLRRGPGVDYPAITELQYGTPVRVIRGDPEEPFWMVSYNGVDGYVARAYVSIEDPDILFYTLQEQCSAVHMPTFFSGMIGEKSSVEIFIDSQDRNVIRGTTTITWRHRYTGQEVSTEQSPFEGRIDYCRKVVEIGEPRGLNTGRYFFEWSRGPQLLSGQYYKYEGGISHAITIEAR